MGSAWRNAKRALGLNLCVHVSRTMGDEKDDVVRHVVSAEGLRASDAAATTSSSPGSSMDAWEIILRMPSTPTPSSVGARISESGTRSSKVMAQAVGRNAAAPLLFLNFIMYIIVIGFASWNLNHFINGQTHHPGVAGNGATFYFLVFAILAGVIGAASKLAGANHIRSWRNDSLAAAAASSLIAWAVTALAFGLACKEIAIGGYRGWRLRALEAFTIILAFTQLLYVLLLHAGMFSSKYGPGYRDPDYGVGGGPGEVKGTARV